MQSAEPEKEAGPNSTLLVKPTGKQTLRASNKLIAVESGENKTKLNRHSIEDFNYEQ